MTSAWKRVIVVVAIVLAAVAGWLVVRDEPRPSTARETVTLVHGPRAAAERVVDAPTPSNVRERARVSKAQRDAVHRRIVDALQRRSRVVDDEDPGATPSEPASHTSTRAPIRNRMGDDDPWGDALVERLGNDFAPLTDECIADVRERVPDLVGMVAMNVTVVGDEDQGGVVESAAPSPDNEIDDPDFLECMRESMLSTALPAPPGSGRRDFTLSLHVEDAP